jgi:hypothetical protein
MTAKYLVVELLADDGETHALRQAPGVTLTECNQAAAFPVGSKNPPTCRTCALTYEEGRQQ